MNGKIYHARIVNPNIRTLWGANSALTAGLVYGVHEGLAPEETISLAMAMAYYVARIRGRYLIIQILLMRSQS